MLGVFRQFLLKENHKIVQISLRHGHTIRGKRPGVARSLEQRLEELNYVDPELSRKVNISLPLEKMTRSQQSRERMDHRKRMKNDTELERLARLNQIQVNLEDVDKDWVKTSGPRDVQSFADYYQVFDHLFGDAFFIPRVHLQVLYPTTGEDCYPVYYGNVLSPEDTKSQPIVEFDPSFRSPGEQDKKDSLWTLVFSTPDGHLSNPEGEYVHWLVANIPNGEIAKGETIVPYFQPFPVHGLGYYRYIFILYKQDSKVNLKDYRVPETKTPDQRSFNTLEFYRKLQDVITPAGLAFFQAEYDDTVREVFHKVFETSMPTFEYDTPEEYRSPQKWFPHKRAFNTYMDLHRDQKQINKEFLERKLKKTHPFDGPEPPRRFPMAHPIKNKPSWLVTELKKERRGIGQIARFKDW